MSNLALLPTSVDERDCRICGQKNSGFNYGVQSCNSCKMFFRRALDTTKILQCKNGGKCSSTNGKCRFCRFHQCIRVGMKFLDTLDISKVICELKEMDSVRRYTFLNCKTSSDVVFNDIFTRGKFQFELKSPDTMYDFYDWGVMNHLTCISFSTKLSFMKFLSPEDLKAIFQHSHLMYMILVTAMRSYATGMASMCHPDLSDIFPKEVQQVAGYNQKLLNEIRCLLVSRLIELRVTEEEFLLLSAILLCNTAISNLSETGQTLLETHRIMYTTTLFRYCQIRYEHHGPTRFNEVLLLSNVIAKTQATIDWFSNLFPIVQPQHVKQNLFTEILAFLLQAS